MNRIHKGISLVLVAAMACWGCQPAYAEEVSVPDALPAVEATGPSTADLADAMAAEPVQMAMFVTVPTDPTAEIAPARVSKLPVTAYAGTGQETRLEMDLASINSQAEREGWPTWAKVTVIVGGVAVVALASWAIVEATQHHGDHTSGDDSSIHLPIEVNGDGNHVNVTWDSPSTSSTRTGY